MSNLSDDDISSSRPTEGEDDLDVGGEGDADTGDEPTEAEENLDVGGEGDADTGDES